MKNNNRTTNLLITILTGINLLILILIACMAIQYACIQEQALYNYSSTEIYYAESGDTLWDIAAAHKDKVHDIRIVMTDIQRLSDCGANIKVGQKLVIPIYDINCINK